MGMRKQILLFVSILLLTQAAKATYMSFLITTGLNKLNPAISVDIVVWEYYNNGIYGATISEPATLLPLGLGALMVGKKRQP